MAITTTRRQAKAVQRNAFAAIAAMLAAILIVGAGPLWAFGRPAEEPNAVAGPFQLVMGDGRAVTDQAFRGKYLLIYFGYTVCPDVCPTTLQSVASALDTLGAKGDRIQPR